MGVVYRAFDPRLDRNVAIKLLRIGGPVESRARLLREAQAMARLSHPNVIAVHDAGILDEQVFIAMELIDGQTLGTWVSSRTRGWRETLAHFIQAGRGLAAAHAAGLVHRDFKPDNVLVDERGRVAVLDFGLARSADEEQPLDGAELAIDLSPTLSGAPLTRTGALLGTPAYMAPEQLRRESASQRTDQFSFCVALYRALYDEPPYGGENIDELSKNVLAGKLREPPRDSRVPGWLHAVIVRGLQVDPLARHPSMDAMLTALERDPWPVRRRRVVTAALVVLASVGGLGLWRAQRRQVQLCHGSDATLQRTWGDARRSALTAAFARTTVPYAADAARNASAMLDRYMDRWSALRVEACEATHVRGEQSAGLLDLRMGCLDERRENLQALVDLFIGADAALVGRAVSAVQSLPDLDVCQNNTALRSLVRLPGDPAIRARVADLQKQIAAAAALGEAGKYSDDVRAADPIVAQAEAIGYRPLEAKALYNAADAEALNGDSKAAERKFVEAALAADAGRDDLTAAQAWTQLVTLVGFEEARYDDGLVWARYAQARLERLGGDPRTEARLLIGIGAIYIEQGKPELALPAHERALALQEKALGPDSNEVSGTLLHLGYDHFARGELDLALAAYQRSLDIRAKTVGTAHPTYATTLINIGNVAYRRRDYAQAAADYQRALAIQERALGPDHPALAATLNNLSNVYSDAKDFDRAAAALKRAIAIDGHTRGFDHPTMAMPIDNLGDVYIEQGKAELALAQYRQALAILTKADGAENPALALPLGKIGEVYVRTGRPREAVPWLERALALLMAHPADPTNVAEAQYFLARAVEHDDAHRAHQLVRAARAAYATAGRQTDVAELDGWLKKHESGK